MKKKNFLKIKFFFNANHHPTRHIKYKINFATCNISAMAHKFLSTNFFM